MTTLLIDLTRTTTNSSWAGVPLNSSDVVTIPDSDADDADSGWTIAYDASNVPTAGPIDGSSPTSGDASWVSDAAAEYSHRVDSDTDWNTLNVTGPPNTAFVADCFSSYNISGRTTQWQVNTETAIDLDAFENDSETATFNSTTDGSGNATIRYRLADGSTGFSSANAIRIIPEAGPSVTLDDSAFEPGKAITGTYANYTSAPTVVTLTDSEDNAISSASEITDLVIDDVAGTYAFTMPDRITTGTGTTLLRGPVTLELT